MENCLFCKIIKGEIPSAKAYEDEKVLAFMDINPVHKGHLLLIPKAHYEWMQDAPEEIIADAFIKTKKLMSAMMAGLPCDYVQISVVGKDVPHFHIHLIPRFLDDGLVGWATQKYEDGEMQSVAEKIKNSL